MQAGPAEPASLYWEQKHLKSFFYGTLLNEACLLFLIMFCGDSLGFAVARGEAGEGGGRVTGDCSVSMASLSFISELSNTLLYAFFYCVPRPGATKYTLYGSCVLTVLFTRLFNIRFVLYFQSVPLLMSWHKYWEHTYKGKHQFSILPLGAFSKGVKIHTSTLFRNL